MKVWPKPKGNRIRASDKSLVYHFCIGWLLLLFVAVFLLLNLRQLLVTDWKDFNLLHADYSYFFAFHLPSLRCILMAWIYWNNIDQKKLFLLLFLLVQSE